jgi:hypothetical protein
MMDMQHAQSDLKRMIILMFAFTSISPISAQSSISEKPLTNNDIVSMVSSKLNLGIIKAAIEKSKTSFDLSPDAMIQLKKNGTPDEVVLAMLSKARTVAAKAPEDTLKWMPPGIYNRSEKGYRPVDPHLLMGSVTRGAFGTLKKTFGSLINFNIKASLVGSRALLLLEETKPAFVFILDYPARNPDDFFLVRLTQTNNARQISFQKMSSLPGIIGINDTVKIAFISKRIQDGIYEVSTTHPLQPGEYCFVYNASSLYQGNSYKGFDFSVRQQLNADGR